MNEAHFAEVEKALLFVSEARKRAARAADAIDRARAEPHLTKAMRELERGLADLHRRAMQQTYFAVPEEDTLFAAVRTDVSA